MINELINLKGVVLSLGRKGTKVVLRSDLNFPDELASEKPNGFRGLWCIVPRFESA